MGRGLFSLRPSEKIKRSGEMKYIFDKGQRADGEDLAILYTPRDDSLRRVGVVVGKKVGKAVKRNRQKRLLREVYRLNKEKFPAGMDFILFCKKDWGKVKYSDVENKVLSLAKTISERSK